MSDRVFDLPAQRPAVRDDTYHLHLQGDVDALTAVFELLAAQGWDVVKTEQISLPATGEPGVTLTLRPTRPAHE